MKGPLLVQVISSHLLVAILPVILLGALAYDANRRSLEDVTHNLNLAVVAQLREAVEGRIQARVQLLSLAERILNDRSSPPENRKQLVKSLIADDQVRYITIRTVAGDVDSLFWRGEERPEVHSELTTELLERAQRQGYAVWPDPDPAWTVVLIPWRVDGETIGYLSSSLPLEQIRHDVSLFADRFLSVGGLVGIYPAQGEFLAMAGQVEHSSDVFRAPKSHPGDASQSLEIELGVAENVITEGGQHWFRAVVSMSELDWWILSAQPTRIALSTVHQLRYQIAILAALAAVLAGLVGLLLARSVTEPITRLAVMVRRSAETGFKKSVQEKGSLELTQLSRGFNDAVELLARRRRELQAETRMRLRLARYLSAPDLQELLSTGLTQKNTPPIGVRQTVVVMDLVPTDENEVLKLPPDRLVLFLGDLFSMGTHIIGQCGGVPYSGAGDTIVGWFGSEAMEVPAEKALDAARELIEEGNALVERWREHIQVSISFSVGIATAEGNTDVDLLERASILQKSACSSGLLTDRATYKKLEGLNVLEPQEHENFDEMVYSTSPRSI